MIIVTPSFSSKESNYKSYNNNNNNNNGMNNNILIARSRAPANIHGWHLEPSKMINHDDVG
jgi:hypothetical protein